MAQKNSAIILSWVAFLIRIMERKLELADIAGYLPYRLRIQHRDLDFVRCVDSVDFTTGDILMYDDSGANYVCITDCLPILRPMSDLVKPMTHPDINGGEEFVPISLIWDNYGTCYKIKNLYYNTEYIHIEYIASDGEFEIEHLEMTPKLLKILNKLFFDHQRLILEGLAIDINTLKE